MQNKIQLNSIWYDLAKSKEKLNQNLPAWEADIFTFLVEWFSDSDTISLQTSGSTGTPKKINKVKSALRHSAMLTGGYFEFEATKTALLCLPAKYIAGKMMLVRAIEWQLSLDYIEPKITLQVPEKPYFFSAMTPQQAKANLSHLGAIKNLIIGGAPISNSLEKELVTLGTNIFATYGMTETVSHVALRKLQTESATTYEVLGEIEITTDTRNCLCIDAPELHPELIVTNDIVKITTEKSFTWVGRYDHIINSGGVKLSPEQIEAKIAELIATPYMISGIPDEQWGEKLILIIEGAPFKTESLMKHIRTKVQPLEIPKKVYFVPEFVRTENQKIKRNPTRDLLIK